MFCTVWCLVAATRWLFLTLSIYGVSSLLLPSVPNGLAGGFGRCGCAGQTSELISKIESDKGRSFRWHWMQITLFRCLVPISYLHIGPGVTGWTNPSYGKWLGKPKTLDLICQPRYVCDRLYNCSDLKGIVMKSAEQWKNTWGFGVYTGDEILPRYVGIIVNHETRIPI